MCNSEIDTYIRSVFYFNYIYKKKEVKQKLYNEMKNKEHSRT